MGKGSGAGVGIALLALLLLLPPRKLTASDFAGAFQPAPSNGFSYTSYVTYVTRPETELEEGEAYEEVASLSGRKGRVLTVNGRIPTPQGTTIPMFSTRDLTKRLQVDKFLQPIEEAVAYSDEPQDRLDPISGKMRIDVSARLKPL